MERVNIIEYRALEAREINRELFDAFIRRQVVTKCWRREGGKWVIRDDPFIDDWTPQDYETLIAGLKETLLAGWCTARLMRESSRALPRWRRRSSGERIDTWI